MDKNKTDKLNKILLHIAIFSFLIIVILILIAVGAFSLGKEENNSNLSKVGIPFSASIYKNEKKDFEYATFSELGQIRGSTKAELNSNKKTSTFVIIPWFSYPKGDFQFVEELSRKTVSIKEIIKNFCSSKTKNELETMGEEKVKNELLLLINKELFLNKIQDIYFSQYIFLD